MVVHAMFWRAFYASLIIITFESYARGVFLQIRRGQKGVLLGIAEGDDATILIGIATHRLRVSIAHALRYRTEIGVRISVVLFSGMGINDIVVGFWRVVTVDLENVRNPMGIICTKHVKKRRPVVRNSTVI